MNSYEAKQEARRERLEAAADRAEARASAAYKRADMSEAATGIPFGQPVLVGHYSEGRHRAAIKRADNAMRKSIDESRRAADLRGRAASVGSGGISSDDPEAVDKLREKMERAEKAQAFMGAANKVIRKAVKAMNGEEYVGMAKIKADYLAALAAIPGGENIGEAAAMKLLQADFCGRIGFASYQLSNNNANIRRMRDRIAHLERAAVAEAKEAEVNGVRVVENVEENRLQLFFPGKPDAAVRAELKSAGFRWAPSAGAWQRQLGNAARWNAERIVGGLKGE